VRALPGVEKLNVGALGNMVPQLHVHVIGRFKGDPAWPGPVWGHSPPVPWPDPALAPLAALVSKD
jgi:diadenosine tetraphosphate (Ap4A) HIT family hydrolase